MERRSEKVSSFFYADVLQYDRRLVVDVSLVNANIVVAANAHNPSIATKDWLLQQGVIREKPASFANTPVLAVYESENLVLTVQAERLQLTGKNLSAFGDLQETVERYVRELPQTPYTAVGLNFVWEGRADNDESIGAILKRLFVGDAGCFAKHFNLEQVGLGGIIKYPYEGFVMRLVVDAHPELGDRAVLDFNFHQAVSSAEQVVDCLRKLPACRDHSDHLVRALLGCGQ